MYIFCGFVQRRRGAVASLSAFEVSRLRGEWDQRLRFNSCGFADFCVKHICSHFSCLKIWGIFEDAACLTVVPGKQCEQLLLHSFFLPLGKHQNILGFVVKISIFNTHFAYGVPKFYQTCFCCHDYHNILTS